MIVASLTSLISGTALAAVTDRYPGHAAILERCAGVMMIAGLALIGHALPFVP